jgi:hypothetical protein
VTPYYGHPDTERSVTSYFEPGVGRAFEPAAVAIACIEHGSRHLLLDEPALPAAFFDLSSGLAGELLHHLGKYAMRLAVVVPDPTVHSAAFQEFVLESNRGGRFRFFPTRGEAVAWLVAFD